MPCWYDDDIIWSDMIRYDMIWYEWMVWYDLIWCDNVNANDNDDYGMTWYDNDNDMIW